MIIQAEELSSKFMKQRRDNSSFKNCTPETTGFHLPMSQQKHKNQKPNKKSTAKRCY